MLPVQPINFKIGDSHYIPPSYEEAFEAMLKENIEVVENYLKAEGAEKPDKKGSTLLHYAASNGNEEMVSLLLRYQANPNAIDQDGNTPLYYCCDPSSIKILLEKGANPRIFDKNDSPVFRAVKNGDFETVREYLDWGIHPDEDLSPDEEDTLLGWILEHKSPSFDHEKIAKLLVEKGADLLYKETEDDEESEYLEQAFSLDLFDLIDTFLAKNPDHPALKEAKQMHICNAYLDVLKYVNRHNFILLLHTGHINDQDHKGNTVLHLIYENSLQTPEDKLKLMTKLISYYQPDTSIANKKGKTVDKCLEELFSLCEIPDPKDQFS